MAGEQHRASMCAGAHPSCTDRSAIASCWGFFLITNKYLIMMTTN